MSWSCLCLKCGKRTCDEDGGILLYRGIVKMDALCSNCARWVARMVRPTVDDQVAEFHEKFDQPNRTYPTTLDSREAHLRVRLVTEEAIEFAEACYGDGHPHIKPMRKAHEDFVNMPTVDGVMGVFNMVRAVDALADIDYVVAGTRKYLGVDQQMIAAEVHRANMAKVGGGKDEGGKVRKPDGWQPPDIAGQLRKMGWLL